MKYVFVITLLALSLNAFAFDREGKSTLTDVPSVQQSKQTNTCDSANGFACSPGDNQ